MSKFITMGIKQKIYSRIEVTNLGRHTINDQRTRIILSAAFSFMVNLVYALVHGALGIANQSLWFITMCAYYTILSVMRFSAILCERKNHSKISIDAEYFVMTLTGILLSALSIVLIGVIYLSLTEHIAAKYESVIMITIATYTFYKITMAILRAVTQRNNPSPLLAVIRCIGYSDVAASVLTLQRSMLVSFGTMSDANTALMNILTGAAVCLFILVLGISMIKKGIKKKGAALWQNQKS